MRLAVADQERAGIDIVTDGEQTRRHFVTTFVESLEGVDFQHKKTVGSAIATMPTCRSSPVRLRAVARSSPRTPRFLRSLTRRPDQVHPSRADDAVDTLYDAHYGSREKLAWAFAEILNEEALAIEAAGVDVIQFDEPAFNVYFDEVRDWGIAALERAAQGLACRRRCISATATASRRTTTGRRVWATNGASTKRPFPCWLDPGIGQVSLECANSHVPLELIGLLDGKDVLVGAIDVASDRIETADQVAATIRAALEYVRPDRLLPCTNCGMVPLARDVARGKLAALARRRRPGQDGAWKVTYLCNKRGGVRTDKGLTPQGILRIVRFVFCFKY